MKNLYFLTIFTSFCLFSCGNKTKEVADSQKPSIINEEISFMNIRIGMPVDSAIAYITSCEDFTDKADPKGKYGEFINYYPDYQTVRYEQNGIDRQLGVEMFGEDNNQCDYGERLGSFFTHIQTKKTEIPIYTRVYSKNNKIVRLMSVTEDKYWLDLLALYENKYGESIIFLSRADFVLENCTSSKSDARFRGGIYKFKNDKRICLINIQEDYFHSVLIVYEDASDYYDFLKRNKEFVDNQKKEAIKKESRRINKLKTQDI